MTQLSKFNLFPGVFDNFFDTDSFWNPAFYGKRTAQVPAVNIQEKEDGFSITMAVPGMKKEDFQVHVDNGLLQVSSERSFDDEVEEERYTRREFSYEAFSRSFPLPKEVDTDNIRANYNDGILRLVLPKKENLGQGQQKKIAVR